MRQENEASFIQNKMSEVLLNTLKNESKTKLLKLNEPPLSFTENESAQKYQVCTDSFSKEMMKTYSP